MVDVEKQKAVTDLIRLPVTSAILRYRSFRVAQSEALKRLEKMCGPFNYKIIDRRSRTGPRSSSFLASENVAPQEMLSMGTSEYAEQISAASKEATLLSTLATAVDMVRIGPSAET